MTRLLQEALACGCGSIAWHIIFKAGTEPKRIVQGLRCQNCGVVYRDLQTAITYGGEPMPLLTVAA